MPTVESLIADMQGYHPQDIIAYHIWQVDDVLGKAKEMEIELTQEEAGEILEDIHRHIDSELGVSWATLESAIEDFDGERK